MLFVEHLYNSHLTVWFLLLKFCQRKTLLAH